ncbi:hemin uptake protein HemP [Sulfurirhabdus autotrophica]|uniref:Hemin uptake protein HemP n=1 Tax=Sulfurirhabdus autotrophica TaxID=1706046 RepID=A0A4R3XQU6_9PROT|nr:hemin uptake protein HemP [Sulfurirhabdus autotrophica]TCV79193.1 hemin uptake protein HemP [Sulfurirhabdus autotrophica]
MQNSRSNKTPQESTQASLDRQHHVFTSETLFRGTNALVIEHKGERYVLRITRNGKLILTK